MATTVPSAGEKTVWSSDKKILEGFLKNLRIKIINKTDAIKINITTEEDKLLKKIRTILIIRRRVPVRLIIL
jgi:hypothetical protein